MISKEQELLYLGACCLLGSMRGVPQMIVNKEDIRRALHAACSVWEEIKTNKEQKW